MVEVWKRVKGFDNYWVSSFGRVMSTAKNPRGILLKPGRTAQGYMSVSLGRKNSKLVHSLVAEAFLGERPEGFDVCHLDGSRDNNSLENLTFGSRAHNNRDAVRHGRRKLTEQQVMEIRASKDILKVIAEKYSISIAHAHQVKKGKALSYAK